MSKRGDDTKAAILKTAKQLFCEKGYFAVTMQDICSQGGFSRGGLYRHFSSTFDIMEELIEEEQKIAFEALNGAEINKIKPSVVIETFFNIRINEIINGEAFIDNAIYNLVAEDAGRDLMKKRADDSVKILARLITLGNECNEFSCDDPEKTSVALMCFLMGISAHVKLYGNNNIDKDAFIKMLMLIIGFDEKHSS